MAGFALTKTVDRDMRAVFKTTLQFPAETFLQSLNLAIASITDGVLKIPAGVYNATGDIIIQLKGDANTGGFKIDATGVVLTGAGRIILDSCKRVTIEGLDAPNHDMYWRGAWWCEFIGMRFRKLVMGDAVGVSFGSTSWNMVRGGQSQAIILHENATSYYNEVTWEGHSMRGTADQGFTGTAAYAFEFNGNRNAQGWKFNGGDISYHASGVYNVAATSIDGDIELAFHGVYFDSVLPAPTGRNDARITTDKCHHANGVAYVASLTAAVAGPVDIFRADRSMRHDASTAINLIPNGDFKDRLAVWLGANLPVGGAGGSAITPMDGGLSGTYLNVNQAATSANAVRFRSKPFPYEGRATATIVMRNATPGEKAMTLSFGGLFPPVKITDAWTVVRVTASRKLAAGAQQDVTIYTNDGTAFNVDVAYVGITMGEGAALMVPSTGFRTIEHSAVHDFPLLAHGTQAHFDASVPGVFLGDFVAVASNLSIGAVQLTASVIAADTVRVIAQNNSGAAVDLVGATYYLRAWKRAYG